MIFFLERNKEKYIRGSINRVNRLFNNTNSIKIETDEKLLSRVFRRKVFKKCPLHRNDPSYQDALIIETLISIKDYIPLNEEDRIFFITKNFKDFSASKDKRETFHPHIEEDLNCSGLNSIVQFRGLLYKTLKDDFKQESIATQLVVEELENYLVKQAENQWVGEADMLDALEDYYNH
ncbi:PIN domain-containing protein [Paenibacillus sp. B2(2019)]|uniref:PIN domain-containing protein n=1 Tax=Paenibacillus sp. B2(2019) TaxID=2607754 RepID=UPI00165F5DF3|nr:PIN domain-containing protein [Paenibacillus sp. B2(2019)]